MPAEDGAITSKNVRRGKNVASDEVLSGNMEELAEVVTKQKTAVAKQSAEKVLSGEENSKILLKMERKNFSWETRSGVLFTLEHPFQLVDESELDELLDEGGFRRADPREVVNFYQER